jgi:hypothetical protein
MGFLTSLWEGIKSVGAWVFPVSDQARGARGLNPVLRWTLHILVLLLILIGLHLLNRYFRLAKLVTQAPLLAENWLPILFLLVYLLGWVAWWLWKLLMPEVETSNFPDIDAAWNEAMNTLGQAGLQITDLPLFLVLGRPDGPEEPLFQAAQLNLVVKQAPGRADAPVHVYASREAAYVSCAGASLLGRQAANLAGETNAMELPVQQGSGEEDPESKTLRPGAAPGMVKDIAAIVSRINREARPPTEDEQRELKLLERKDRPRQSLLKNPAELALHTARMEHLYRLIVRDRRPYCPLNGVLVLVPYAASDSDDDATQTGDLLRRDLEALRRVLRVHCPLFALICDLETTNGFREFIQRLQPKDRQRRVGQRFPLAADLNGQQLLDQVDGAVQWMCNSLLASWVYKLFFLEGAGREDVNAVVRGNTKLYQLLSQMRERQKRISRVLSLGLTSEASGPMLFGGCYVAGTGRDPAREQAFVAGVFKRLVENQNFVSWTDAALAEDDYCQRWATRGYAILGVVGAAVLALIGWQLFGGAGRGTKKG